MNKTLTYRLALGSLALGFGLAAAAPQLAQAAPRDVRNYDGYCYMKQAEAKRNGAIIGAVTGGLIGSQVSKNERGLGAIAGAVIGGTIGSNVGKDGAKCYDGEYYSYQGKYYDPPSAPSGYVPVFYEQRPPERVYTRVYYDRDHHDGPPPYGYGNAWKSQGWRDSHGRWHDGAPPRGYRQDRNGYWRR